MTQVSPQATSSVPVKSINLTWSRMSQEQRDAITQAIRLERLNLGDAGAVTQFTVVFREKFGAPMQERVVRKIIRKVHEEQQCRKQGANGQKQAAKGYINRKARLASNHRVNC